MSKRTARNVFIGGTVIFWIIFGLGFLHGTALLIKDVLTIGRKAPEAVPAPAPAEA